MKKFTVKGIWNITYLAKDKQDAFNSASKMINTLNNPNVKLQVQEIKEGDLSDKSK